MEFTDAANQAKEANSRLDLVDDMLDSIKLVVESQVGPMIVTGSFIRSINETEAIAICQGRIVVVSKIAWTVIDIIVDLRNYNK